MKRYAFLAIVFLLLTGQRFEGDPISGLWGTFQSFYDAIKEEEERAKYEAIRSKREIEQQAVLARAEGGDPHAQFEAHYFSKSDAESRRWLCLSANQGYALAQHVTAVKYQYESTSEPNGWIRAYLWFSLAASRPHAQSVAARDYLAKKMTPRQIAEAKRLVAKWKPDPSTCGVAATNVTTTERVPVEIEPPETRPLCRDVGGYEAYMKRTGEVCRLN